MKMKSAQKTIAETVDAYLAKQPQPARSLLLEIRKTIKALAPDAEEVLSYGIPAFKQNGMLVWYAAFKNHIGFYPRASGIEKFRKELSVYKMAKGSVQFPMDEELPLALIRKIVKHRVKENMQKDKDKKGK